MLIVTNLAKNKLLTLILSNVEDYCREILQEMLEDSYKQGDFKSLKYVGARKQYE